MTVAAVTPPGPAGPGFADSDVASESRPGPGSMHCGLPRPCSGYRDGGHAVPTGITLAGSHGSNLLLKLRPGLSRPPRPGRPVAGSLSLSFNRGYRDAAGRCRGHLESCTPGQDRANWYSPVHTGTYQYMTVHDST